MSPKTKVSSDSCPRVITYHDREPKPEDSPAETEFVAYRLQGPHIGLIPSPRQRAWMIATPGKPPEANRCLPLLMANSAGWVLLSAGRVTCIWGGEADASDVSIHGHGSELPLSHFGSGIVTWRIPYLFRTPPGWNLLMRGPANLPKDGASSLEGMIETDWAVQPAFHSWKLTRAAQPVTWEAGEPICMIVPVRPADLEAWQPRTEDIFSGPDEMLRNEYLTFSKSRTDFNAGTRLPKGWQGDYFRGRSPGNARATGTNHRRALKIKPFRFVES